MLSRTEPSYFEHTLLVHYLSGLRPLDYMRTHPLHRCSGLHDDQDQDPPDYQVVCYLELKAEVGHIAGVDEGEVIELHDPGPGGAVLGLGEVLAGVQPQAKAYGGAQPAAQDRGSRKEQLRPCGALETAQRRKIGSGRERHEATGARGQQAQGGPR